MLWCGTVHDACTTLYSITKILQVKEDVTRINLKISRIFHRIGDISTVEITGYQASRETIWLFIPFSPKQLYQS